MRDWFQRKCSGIFPQLSVGKKKKPKANCILMEMILILYSQQTKYNKYNSIISLLSYSHSSQIIEKKTVHVV